MPDNNKKLQQVINYIEESLRNSTKSNFEYIDLKNQKSRILSNQNHIIFGRRGAGKSSLLNVLGKDKNDRKGITIRVNIEDFKDVPFPNIIIQVLLKLLTSLDYKYSKLGFFNFKKKGKKEAIKKKTANEIASLKQLLKEPENYELSEKNKGTYQESGKAAAKLKAMDNEMSTEVSASEGKEHEESRTYIKNKLLDLRDKLVDYKEIVNDYSNLFELDYIFIAFDDFYFIPRSIQNKFIDYFHRLTKDTTLFLKVASIKFRSRLYAEENGTYIGTELNHDISPIDLDYTLEDFNSLSDFMKKILSEINKKFDSYFIEDYFAGDGFSQLCLASGGVPRDFLSLLSGLLQKIMSNEIQRIGKIEVTEMAISLINGKLSSIRSDSGEEVTKLETTIQLIKHEVINTKRCNIFLICKDDIDNYTEEYDFLRQLMDLRIIHLVNTNTSCAPGDGKRYEAYMVDIGLYPNSRLTNFNQVDLTYRDEKSRNDQIRSAPKLSLQKINEALKAPVQIKLA